MRKKIWMLSVMMLLLVGCGKIQTQNNPSQQVSESMSEKDTESQLPSENEQVTEDSQTTEESQIVENSQTTENPQTTENSQVEEDSQAPETSEDTQVSTESESKSESESEDKKPSEDKNPSTDKNDKEASSENKKPSTEQKPSEDKKPSTEQKPSEDKKPESTDPEFVLSTTSYELTEWQTQWLGYEAERFPGITWKTANPDVVQVVDNTIYSIYPGKTKITASWKGQSVTIDVTVKADNYHSLGLNTDMITLFPKESFELIPTHKGVSYKSANTKIATVTSSGVVKGVAPGITTITVSDGKNSKKCEVEVVENNGHYYTSKLDTKYNVIKKRTLYTSDRVVLIADAGTYIPKNLMKNIENLMSALERLTGLSYTKPLSGLTAFGSDKVVIYARNTDNASAYGSSEGAAVLGYDLYFEQQGVYVLAHELTHTLQLRNSVSLLNPLTEAFSTYFGTRAMYEFSYPKSDAGWVDPYMLMNSYGFTKANMENELLNENHHYTLGYLFMEHLMKDYGKGIIKEILTDANTLAKQKDGFIAQGMISSLTKKEVMDIVKKHTSKNVVDNFYKKLASAKKGWGSTVMDLTGKKTHYVTFAGHDEMSFFLVQDGIKANGKITLDFTKGIDFAQKVYGRKYRGFYGSSSEMHDGVKRTYYDANGNVVEPVEVREEDYGFYVMVENAVRVTYEYNGTFDLDLIDWKCFWYKMDF